MRLISSEAEVKRLFFRTSDVTQQRFSNLKLPLNRLDAFMNC